MNNYKKYAISLVGSTIFAIVDSIFFLLINSRIENYLLKFKALNITIIHLFVGGLAAACGLSITTFIKGKLKTLEEDIIEEPLIDAIGVIIGTMIVVLIYLLIKKLFGSKYIK